jgi:xanthine/CO dehydrogenase XdhC/CoxF family maturation factor
VNELVEQLRHCWGRLEPCVVATIIRVDGSAYRREGSRCLVLAGGDIVGIVSGGCVEQEIRLQAEEVLESGEAKIVTYDFRQQGDDVWGFGVGCNGAITVLLERFDPVRSREQARALLDDLEQRDTCDRPYYAVTVVRCGGEATVGRLALPMTPPALAANAVWRPELAGERCEPSRRWQLPEAAAGFPPLPASTAAALVCCELGGVSAELFVERIQPPPTLVIVGTGADASLLSQMAKRHGWRVWIAYHETAGASKAAFPEADRIVHGPRADFSALPLGADHYVAVMAHNLDIDQAALRDLLPKPVAYVGLLGSKDRIARMMERLGAEKDSFSPEWSGKLHAPIGLDIGAQTPEDITLSIMAELIACRNGRSGGSMRLRQGSATMVLG